MNRVIVGLAFVAVIGLAALLLTGPNREQVQRLPDGSSLRLTKVKFGTTNEFLHGTRLEKLLGPILPPKGIRIGKFTLSPPKKLMFQGRVTNLTVEFRLDQAGEPWSIQIGKCRWIIQGGDKMRYVEDAFYFIECKDGCFTYLSTSLFPRDARKLFITLENREREGADWHEAATFVVKKPVIQIAR